MTKHKQAKAKRRKKIKDREAAVKRNAAQCEQTTRITVVPPTVPDSLAPTIGEDMLTPTKEPDVEDDFDKSMA